MTPELTERINSDFIILSHGAQNFAKTINDLIAYCNKLEEENKELKAKLKEEEAVKE